MPVITKEIEIDTRGNNEILDLTPLVEKGLAAITITDGSVTVFIPGSTAGVTTIEFESGAVKDLKEAFERLIPREMEYEHNRRWGDGNGFSHVRAALCKASLTVPFVGQRLLLGTWQQIVLVDFDNRPRRRRVILQFLGE
ncbi:MAG: YjbQ family protein [Deltaproteobacteria bacterium]|nr:YjbQ family protein [Deltaproteobacteria bacterium]